MSPGTGTSAEPPTGHSLWAGHPEAPGAWWAGQPIAGRPQGGHRGSAVRDTPKGVGVGPWESWPAGKGTCGGAGHTRERQGGLALRGTLSLDVTPAEAMGPCLLGRHCPVTLFIHVLGTLVDDPIVCVTQRVCVSVTLLPDPGGRRDAVP